MKGQNQKRHTPSNALPRHVSGLPWIICLFLAATTIAVFWSVLRHDFVNIDDDIYVTLNERVLQGFNLQGVYWAFTNFQAGFWHPLTWLSHMLDVQLYGMRAGGHHLSNLLLHAANTALVFIVFWRMTGAVWRCALVAVLFALHPLHVEPVAWVSSRKDVLSTFFGLLTLLSYHCYAQAQRESRRTLHTTRSALRFYILSLTFFACSLMSKTMTVTLPVVLLLLDWWPLQRFSPDNPRYKLWHLIREKIPFLIAAFLSGLATMHAERGAGALPSTIEFPIRMRLANVITSYANYLFQSVWPFDLAVFYPYPNSFSPISVIIAALLLVGITIAVFRLFRSRPYLLTGWLWFVITLLPVIGFIQVGRHAGADRYTYVPLLGIFIILAWCLADLVSRLRISKIAIAFSAALIIAASTARSVDQLHSWKNSETLFRHALAVTRGNYLAHYNLALALARQGLVDSAADHCRQAIEIRPEFTDAHNDLGVALALQGRMNEAIAQFQEAIRCDTNFIKAYNNLGNAMVSQGRLEDAVQFYTEALSIYSDYPDAQFNLGIALQKLGRIAEAKAHFAETLRIQRTHNAAKQQLLLLEKITNDPSSQTLIRGTPQPAGTKD